ncbi:unnamed protein product, partial [Chrysoparadoxa australica]
MISSGEGGGDANAQAADPPAEGAKGGEGEVVDDPNPAGQSDHNASGDNAAPVEPEQAEAPGETGQEGEEGGGDDTREAANIIEKFAEPGEGHQQGEEGSVNIVADQEDTQEAGGVASQDGQEWSVKDSSRVTGAPAVETPAQEQPQEQPQEQLPVPGSEVENSESAQAPVAKED